MSRPYQRNLFVGADEARREPLLPLPAIAPVPGQDLSTSFSLGNGFGSLRVDGAGTVKFSGMLADGTKISQSSQVSGNGTWPLFVPLYKGKGMLIAWISFTNRASDDLHGAVNWIKQSDLLAHYYSGGFALAGMPFGSVYKLRRRRWSSTRRKLRSAMPTR